MKYILLPLLLLITYSVNAQTKPPTIEALVKLYTDTNMAAINDYAHQMGFKGEPFGYSEVGNTYDYMHYSFAEKDTTNKQHTYLGYAWGQHGIHIPYSLINLSYGTNSQVEFDVLVNELKALDFIIEEAKNDVLPHEHIYYYKGIYIVTRLSMVPNIAKYSITIGRRNW